MIERLFVVMSLCVLSVSSASARRALWAPKPLVVHEWGVARFDWGTGRAKPAELEPFIYTDKVPDEQLPEPEQRVKDSPGDTGARDKPILYFYTPGNTTVGVEERFSHGHATAWWPNVHVYRTPEETARAKPVDLEAWRKERLRQRMRNPRKVRVPDDERFELVWHRLQLTKDKPKGQHLQGILLPKEHWVRRAREVDSAFVSNGRELEKFLFYEGRTRERPVLAILPPDHRHPQTCHVVNVGERTVYDVFAIYRKGKTRWAGYVSRLEPVPERNSLEGPMRHGHAAPQIGALAIPDVSQAEVVQGIGPIDDEAFRRRTRKRMMAALTEGEHYTPLSGGGLRDPAVPQPPCRMHQLYEKEAEALLAIWGEEFFAAEGLTLIYRESPEALDEAMPLNIYTDMWHVVKLSRCGLVLNRNIALDRLKDIRQAVLAAAARKPDQQDDPLPDLLTTNRYHALGLAEFIRRQRWHGEGIEAVMERLENEPARE